MRSATAFLILVGSVLAAREARAHIELVFPPTRVQFEQDEYPCGTKAMRGNKVTAFRPGQTIVVKWIVGQEHTMPGHFRIAIDDSGQDFPVPPNVSALPFAMNVDASGLRTIEQEITLPNIQCSNCTLQLIQQTAQEPPFDQGSFYYQCADITIGGEPTGTTATGSTSNSAGSGSSSNSTSGSPSTSTSGGSGSTTSGSAGSGNAGPPAEDSGGCSTARPGNRGSAWTALLLLPLIALRRRQKDG